MKIPWFSLCRLGAPVCPRVQGYNRSSGRRIPAPSKARRTAEPPNSPLLNADSFHHKHVLSPWPNVFHRRWKVKFVQCL